MMVAICLAFVLVLSLNAGILMIWVTVQQQLTEVGMLSQPYVLNASTHALGLLKNAEIVSEEMTHVAHMGRNMTRDSQPELTAAVRNTSLLLARLERLAAHPTIKIALGDDAESEGG